MLRGSVRYARVGIGRAQNAKRMRLGRATLPAVALFLGIVLISLGVPFLTIGRWLIKGGASVWDLVAIGHAFWQTLLLAIGGAVLAVILAVPTAWLSNRKTGPLPRLLEAANYIVGALPGVVVALAWSRSPCK